VAGAAGEGDAMSLVRMQPQDAMQFWDEVKECIASALPPHLLETPETLLQVQEQVLVGQLECWLAVREQQLYGVLTTRVVSEFGQRSLLVFSVATLEHPPASLWPESIEVLKKYAASKQCSRVLAYSNHERLVQVAEYLGADTSWRLIQWLVT
jgi:hypothetical protein